ncbi:SUMF1/EgtB/PvdO family nonheme iron enzyme [Pseudanabaena sp. PCC 6802]|uniref:SUMF1/EgtB/PvdO family nonheme iron enzyme n=1 Tax=Pseudanabaena sp. PCC 6802 TaxID=118173 RepID=UPI0039A06403
MAHRLGLSSKLMRGGSWNNNARNCRSSNRNRNNARDINNNVGFRVVLVSSL